MKRNFLNIKDNELDTPIYRVFSKKRLFEVFQNKQLVLVRPKLWDDPFENYIMNSTGQLNDGRLFKIDFRNNFYGQCWTLKKESDAIWRIYAPGNDGIKVKTTIRKLLTSLYVKGGEFKDIACFIGKVEYYKKEELKKFLEDSKKISSMLIDTSGVGQATTLLFKRLAFSHEKEVRLIYYSPEKLIDDKYFLGIDPLNLFDEITIDPRTNYSDFKSWKGQLKNWGYQKKIIRSLLYKTPDLKFKFDK